MTDAINVLKETNKERSNLKNSAFHKKNGSAVSKLGNKPMSWQEINSKHGPVKTYPSMDSFMEYDEFKLLPPDLKVQYVNGLCKKYKIKICHVSEHLFGAGEKGLMAYLKIFDLYKQCASSGEWTEENAESFRIEVENWRNRKEISDLIDQEAQEARLSEFMTYDAFKKFSLDDRVRYVNGLIDRYKVGLNTISKVLFEKNESTLWVNFKSAGRLSDIHKLDKRHLNRLQQREVIEAFKETIDAWKKQNVVAYAPIAKKEEPVTPNDILEPAEEYTEKMNNQLLASIIGSGEVEKELEPVNIDEETIVDSCDDAEPMTKPEIVKIDTPKTIIIDRDDAEPETICLDVIKMKEIPVEEEKKASVSQYDAHFKTSYISESGLDEKQIFALLSLFTGKKIKVNIEIEALD